MRIRTATMEDLDMITRMEATCFPPAEAAPRELFAQRLASYPEHFWLLEEEGVAVSCINGFVTDQSVLVDEMFADASMHDENGAWQMIFGVMTLPEYQRRGYAEVLMKHVIEECMRQGRRGIVLTCKHRLISFYEQFGYRNVGESVSNHGGAQWYEMRMELRKS